MKLESTVVVKLYFSNAQYHLIILVFCESDRLSLANGICATHKEELIIRRVLR